jgi:hypothetical protein
MQAPTIGRIVAVVALLAIGCSKKPAEQTAARDAKPSAAPATGSTTTAEGTTGTEVQLAGTLGCGHCVFHVTSECSPCVKTATGDVYVIDGVKEGSELWAKRLEDGVQIALSGSVLGATDDNLKHVAMTSFEIK